MEGWSATIAEAETNRPAGRPRTMSGGFGRAAGGGRRSARRQPAAEQVCLSTLARTFPATLVDLSVSGLRLRAGSLPTPGEKGSLKVGGLTLYGEVRWTAAGECGFALFEPLTGFQLATLVRECRKAFGDSPELRAAREAWEVERIR